MARRGDGLAGRQSLHPTARPLASTVVNRPMHSTFQKPKPLRDIRYFENNVAPQRTEPMPGYASKLYDFPRACIALGQRVGMKCEELGVSIGRADHLYLCLTPSLPEGTVETTEYAMESWHRFALYGMDLAFNALSEEKKLAKVTEATFATLRVLAADQERVLEMLRHSVESQGEALRVCLKVKATKQYHVRVEQTVPVHPQPAEVFVEVTHLKTQRSKSVKVAEVAHYDDAPSLVDRIAIIGDELTVHPRKSFRASLVTKDYQVPIQLSLAGLKSV